MCVCVCVRSRVCVILRGSSFFRHSGVLPAAPHRLQRRPGEAESARLFSLQGVSSPSNPRSPPSPQTHTHSRIHHRYISTTTHTPLLKTKLGSKHATTAARYPPILPQSHHRRSSRLPPSETARRLHRVMPLLQREKYPATAHILDACRRTQHHSLGP